MVYVIVYLYSKDNNNIALSSVTYLSLFHVFFANIIAKTMSLSLESGLNITPLPS